MLLQRYIKDYSLIINKLKILFYDKDFLSILPTTIILGITTVTKLWIGILISFPLLGLSLRFISLSTGSIIISVLLFKDKIFYYNC